MAPESAPDLSSEDKMSLPSIEEEAPAPGALMRARLTLVLASILWSIGGLLMKCPPLAEIPLNARGPLLACLRTLFAGLFFLFLVSRERMRFRWGLIPTVTTFALMNVSYVLSVTMTSAAAAIFLQFTSTVWAALMGVVVLKERLDRTTLIPLAGTLVGIFWIVSSHHSPDQFWGNVLGLASGVFYGGVVVSLRAMRREDSMWLISLNQLGASLLVMPWAMTVDYHLSATQWALISFSGVVQMAIPYLLFARSVRVVKSSEAALIPVLEPILNPIWVWLAWGEEVDSSILLGGALILGTLIMKYTLDAWLAKRQSPEPAAHAAD